MSSLTDKQRCRSYPTYLLKVALFVARRENIWIYGRSAARARPIPSWVYLTTPWGIVQVQGTRTCPALIADVLHCTAREAASRKRRRL